MSEKPIDFYERIIETETRPEDLVFEVVENMFVLSGIISKATDWHVRRLLWA